MLFSVAQCQGILTLFKEKERGTDDRAGRRGRPTGHQHAKMVDAMKELQMEYKYDDPPAPRTAA
jgi:hypothetical protein